MSNGKAKEPAKRSGAVAAAATAPLVKHEPQTLTHGGNEVPEDLRQSEPIRGMGQEDKADLILPRLAICQSMSPHRKRGDSKFIEGLEEGHIFNTLTKRNYGSSCYVVPLVRFKTRILFQDRDAGGGILCRSDDFRHGVGDPGGECAKCPFSQWETNGKERTAPRCTEFHNFATLVIENGSTEPKMEDMAVASFKRTAIGAGRKFYTLMKMRGTDPYKGVYVLTTHPEKGPKGDYYVPDVDNAGWIATDVQDSKLRATIINSYKAFQEQMLNVQEKAPIVFDTEDLTGEVVGDAHEGPGDE